MSSRREFFTRRSDFDSALTKNVRQLLSPKIENRYNKYLVASPAQLHATLNDAGAVVIAANDGKNMNYCFEASDDTMVLLLSINAAVRELLFLDVPFVADSKLANFDSLLRRSCYQFISRISEQTVILESSYIVEELGLRPNFQLLYDSHCGRLKIEELPRLN